MPRWVGVAASERQSVAFYDYWVNGKSMRNLALLLNRYPHSAPLISNTSGALSQNPNVLHLQETTKTLSLPKLRAEYLRPVPHILLHGSQATGDTCPFSDVDVMVVVEDREQFDVSVHRAAIGELKRLLRAIYCYDPLMHHGLMFFAASGLDTYDQSFLPLDTLRRAIAVHGGPIPVRDTLHAANAVESLRESSRSLRKQFDSGHFLTNDFDLKRVVAGILLMPARVLAAHGTYVYKRESFELAKSYFTPAQWDFILRAEAIRATWIKPRAKGHLLPSSLHPEAIVRVTKRFPPRLNAQRLGPETIAGLKRSAKSFLDRVDDSI